MEHLICQAVFFWSYSFGLHVQLPPYSQNGLFMHLSVRGSPLRKECVLNRCIVVGKVNDLNCHDDVMSWSNLIIVIRNCLWLETIYKVWFYIQSSEVGDIYTACLFADSVSFVIMWGKRSTDI